MIINSASLLDKKYSPIKAMLRTKTSDGFGTSYGMSEAGYDIRINQTITFYAWLFGLVRFGKIKDAKGKTKWFWGNFCLASAMEEFHMPPCLVGIVHDKSTWARKGVSVFNTVIEPGWKGFLTLEIVSHSRKTVKIYRNQGIAQVVFHKTSDEVFYEGKYQNQPNRPVNALHK